jgi:hypothetical protein
MKVKIIFFFLALGFGMALLSCTGNRGERSDKKNYDSLFLGIYLGMDKKAFYDHCWELNRQKVFTHGPTNTSIEYKLHDLQQPIMMRFYPSFYKDKVFEMPVTFSYEAWAPWNKEFSSHELFVNILPVFKKWYGEDFKAIEHPRMGTIYIKMDGTRRINLFIRDDQFVQAVFTDLKVEQEMKDEEKKISNDREDANEDSK